jgi:hypothetical protein
MTLIQKHSKLLLHKVVLREFPRYSNAGPEVEIYLKVLDLQKDTRGVSPLYIGALNRLQTDNL